MPTNEANPIGRMQGMPVAASDILRNPVKDKLARGEVVASMTVRVSRSIEIARIAATAGFDISRILDAGALGVITPHVRSAAEARAVAKAAKLPPLGERSNTGAFPHLRYRSFPAEETARRQTNRSLMDSPFGLRQFGQPEQAGNAARRGGET